MLHGGLFSGIPWVGQAFSLLVEDVVLLVEPGVQCKTSCGTDTNLGVHSEASSVDRLLH